MVKVTDAPVHPFKEGVTVTVPEIGTAPAFIVIKLGIFPVPEPSRPIAGFEFVQLNTVLDKGPVKLKFPLGCPTQTVTPDTASTDGRGFTVTGCVMVVVPHSLVTSSVINCEPEVEKLTIGEGEVEVAGIPPEKVHA